MYERDTIAAIATPPGPGAIGIVRTSGPAARSIANEVFVRAGGEWESHRLYHGRIIGADGRPLDEAMAALLLAPRSYTGEDVLELYCHGSPVVLRQALEAVLRRGARPARGGEFTQRAFLNGKLDLTQAEAVIDLIRARTPETASQAANQLFGHLSRHLEHLRGRLVRVKAHLEACIDFAEEEIDTEDRAVLTDIDSVCENVRALLRTYARGRLMREGLRVVIAGPPNVGKSSLLNALLGEERAIVTPIPGTTRDLIEESADFYGIPVILRDTAGLCDSRDEVERIGVDRARSAARDADVVLSVLDLSVPPTDPPQTGAEARTVIVLNKIDLPCAWTQERVRALEAHHQLVRASATQALGLDDLRRAVVALCDVSPGDGAPPVTTSRQRDALQKVLETLEYARSGVMAGVPPDLVAVDVQAALDHIGEVTGVVSSEDVLDAIFREFCVGK
jgi:tRNA modification GTPase